MTVSIGTREYRIPYSTNPNQMGPNTINHQRHSAARHHDIWVYHVTKFALCSNGLVQESRQNQGGKNSTKPTGLQNLVCSVPLVSVRSVRSRGVFNPGTTSFGRPACSKNDGFVIDGNLGDSSCKKWRWLVEQQWGCIPIDWSPIQRLIIIFPLKMPFWVYKPFLGKTHMGVS